MTSFGNRVIADIKMKSYPSSCTPNLTDVLMKKENMNRHAKIRLEFCHHKPRTYEKLGKAWKRSFLSAFIVSRALPTP